MTWKDKDCSNCTFRVDRVCRRFPPNAESEKMWNTYPQVHSSAHGYMLACSEYSETIQPLTIKEATR